MSNKTAKELNARAEFHDVSAPLMRRAARELGEQELLLDQVWTLVTDNRLSLEVRCNTVMDLLRSHK